VYGGRDSWVEFHYRWQHGSASRLCECIGSQVFTGGHKAQPDPHLYPHNTQAERRQDDEKLEA
jgi:hypothetical protein